MKKQQTIVAIMSFVSLFWTATASAHVVVKPDQALTGAFQTFTISVPNEKDAPTTSLKLDIPEQLQYVTPTVKSGWNIQTDKQGSGEDAKIKSITWANGTIPAGFRDEFTFSAKLPSTPAEIHWNAYQTYEDGTTVSWNIAEDKQPKKADGTPDFSTSGSFSITKVTTENPTTTDTVIDRQNDSKVPLGLSISAVVISLAALALARSKK